jgi:hypothetical protein
MADRMSVDQSQNTEVAVVSVSDCGLSIPICHYLQYAVGIVELPYMDRFREGK